MTTAVAEEDDTTWKTWPPNRSSASSSSSSSSQSSQSSSSSSSCFSSFTTMPTTIYSTISPSGGSPFSSPSPSMISPPTTSMSLTPPLPRTNTISRFPDEGSETPPPSPPLWCVGFKCGANTSTSDDGEQFEYPQQQYNKRPQAHRQLLELYGSRDGGYCSTGYDGGGGGGANKKRRREREASLEEKLREANNRNSRDRAAMAIKETAMAAKTTTLKALLSRTLVSSLQARDDTQVLKASYASLEVQASKDQQRAKELACSLDQFACVACKDAQRSKLMMPCRHLCLCDACYKTMRKAAGKEMRCPSCRAIVKSSAKVFM